MKVLAKISDKMYMDYFKLCEGRVIKYAVRIMYVALFNTKYN